MIILIAVAILLCYQFEDSTQLANKPTGKYNYNVSL